MGKCWNKGKNTSTPHLAGGLLWPNPKKGLCGQDVVYIQLLLKEAGFNPYYCDGWYGSLTEFAVRSYQLHTGLPVTGEVDEKPG